MKIMNSQEISALQTTFAYFTTETSASQTATASFEDRL